MGGGQGVWVGRSFRSVEAGLLVIQDSTGWGVVGGDKCLGGDVVIDGVGVG